MILVYSSDIVFCFILGAFSCFSPTSLANRKGDKIHVVYKNGNERDISLDTNADVLGGGELDGASDIYLVGANTLSDEAYSPEIIDNILMSGAALHMCIVVHNKKRMTADINLRSISGTCKGPQLAIVGNPMLNSVFLNDALLNFFSNRQQTAASNVRPVVIRGNKMLTSGVVAKLSKYDKIVDMQRPEECLLPNPLSSAKNVTKDTCELIRHNKKLCLDSEMEFIISSFGHVETEDNMRELCGRKCSGGVASDYYLRQLSNCSYVYGDLIISDWLEAPPISKKLHNIEYIKGRLIIERNPLLKAVDFLPNLETIEPLKRGDSLIIIRDNPELRRIQLKRLKGVEIKEGNPQLELHNNPKLFARPTSPSSSKRQTLVTSPKATTTSAAVPKLRTKAVTKADTKIYIKPTTEKQRHLTRSYGEPSTVGISDQTTEIGAVGRGQEQTVLQEKKSAATFLELAIISGAIGAVIVLLIIIVALIVVFLLKSKSKPEQMDKLPPPPNKLSKKSRKILDSMSKEIAAKDPLSWCASSEELLWKTKQQPISTKKSVEERSAAGADPKTSARQSQRSSRGNSNRTTGDSQKQVLERLTPAERKIRKMMIPLASVCYYRKIGRYKFHAQKCSKI
ncbi:hypothetical protein Q1695_012583 [Nippostrongylus brasiliensis]|nr:hypothetical protein Q1695_012583 [Nippostrongylus brasiliensis]